MRKSIQNGNSGGSCDDPEQIIGGNYCFHLSPQPQIAFSPALPNDSMSRPRPFTVLQPASATAKPRAMISTNLRIMGFLRAGMPFAVIALRGVNLQRRHVVLVEA